MIHAFVAGFAGCIGVLVALWCWNRTSEWQANRAYRREYRRIARAERRYASHAAAIVRQRKRQAAFARFLSSVDPRIVVSGYLIIFWGAAAALFVF